MVSRGRWGTHTLIEKSRARSSWCCGLTLSHELVLHIGMTSLHLSPLDRNVQEKLLWNDETMKKTCFISHFQTPRRELKIPWVKLWDVGKFDQIFPWIFHIIIFLTEIKTTKGKKLSRVCGSVHMYQYEFWIYLLVVNQSRYLIF